MKSYVVIQPFCFKMYFIFIIIGLGTPLIDFGNEYTLHTESQCEHNFVSGITADITYKIYWINCYSLKYLDYLEAIRVAPIFIKFVTIL